MIVGAAGTGTITVYGALGPLRIPGAAVCLALSRRVPAFSSTSAIDQVPPLPTVVVAIIVVPS